MNCGLGQVDYSISIKRLRGAALLAALVLSTPPTETAPGTETPTFVLGPEGMVYAWSPGETELRPLPPALEPAGGRPINDLGTAGDGGRLVVLPSTPVDPAHPKRQRGSALVLSIGSPIGESRKTGEVSFDGDGRRVAVSRDGHMAYVLAIRTVPGAGIEQMLTWLHALDLDAGRVVSSAQLDLPPSAIALNPAGDRLFLGYAATIVSYTTHPLTRSWHYRSPGGNRDLCFRPGSAVLCSARSGQVALFDPAVIAAWKPEQRQKRTDDATKVIPLSINPGALLFSRDGLLAAAAGPGKEVAFFDPASGKDLGLQVVESTPAAKVMVRPFHFASGPGDLAVGVFPDRRVVILHPPALPASLPEPTPTSEPTTTPEQKAAEPIPTLTPAPSPEPLPSSTPVMSPMTTPTPAPTPTPDETPNPEASVRPAESIAVLAGKLSGRVEAVKAIVIYGPGSIVREQARIAPSSDGAWRIPLPPPGTYRVVPQGDGSRPLRCEPHFHTVEVKGEARTDLDFRVLGTS